MIIKETNIEGLMLITPRVFTDDRGYFFESFNASNAEVLNRPWVQDNESKSSKNVLRGLHYQVGAFAQAKLVRAITGAIFDVAVDIRLDSPTYGEWYGATLDDTNKQQLLIPRGCAHGFLVLSEVAIFSYKCDNYYSKEHEGGINFADAKLDIKWPLISSDFKLSEKDKTQPTFGNHLPF